MQVSLTDAKDCPQPHELVRPWAAGRKTSQLIPNCSFIRLWAEDKAKSRLVYQPTEIDMINVCCF